MPRRILLVRHCQSEANAEGRIEGRGDSPLSAEGQAQAELVAAFVAEACGWTVAAHDHRIREGELGWMEDLPYTEVGRHMAEKKVRELDADLHGGESLAVVAERFSEALAEAIEGHHGPLVLVSHGYAIQALLRRLDPDVALPRFIGNGDVVEIWLEDGALAEAPKHFPLKPSAPH